MTKKPDPGVSREQRISDEGLRRLEKQSAVGCQYKCQCVAAVDKAIRRGSSSYH